MIADESARLDSLRHLVIGSVVVSVLGMAGAGFTALSLMGRGERDLRLDQEQVRIALIQKANQDDIAVVKTQVAAALTASTAASAAVLNLTTLLILKNTPATARQK